MNNLSKMLLVFSVFASGGVAIADQNPSYYDKFKYKVVGSCAKDDSIMFREAHSWKSPILGTNAKGEPIVAYLSIQIFDDGSYWADYSEVEIFEGVPGANSGGWQTFSKKVEGKWIVDGDTIQFLGLGTGSHSSLTTMDSKIVDAIDFEMKTVLRNSGAQGAHFVLGTAMSNTAARGLSINQFCGRSN